MQQFSPQLKNYVSVVLFFSCYLFSTSSAFSQGTANNWYFGDNAGITFNTNPPTALTNGQMNTGEGCAAVSDANGNLLFYTDGTKVWNRNHTQMPNGSGLMGNSSATQSAIIVPKPGSSTNYYIITTPSNTGYTTDTTMWYSEVNMTLDSSRGDIIPGIKNLPLFSPVSEKVTAVKHANGLYYWVIGKEALSKKYRAYLIDCNGVNTTAVVSNAGIFNGGGGGSLVSSPDGSRLAAGRGSNLEITRFNNASGVVYDSTNIGAVAGYGVAFSPDGKRLYATNFSSWTLYQWDMESTPISASQTFIGNTRGAGANLGLPGNYRGGALQLAPDGKIYVAEYNKPSLGVINYPNVSGVGCDFDTNAVSLSGRNCRLGLPNFPSYNFDITPVFSYSGSCSNQNVIFTINSNAALLDSVQWNFGDTASGANNVSSSISSSHIFNTGGAYNVQLVRYADCVKDTATISVFIIGNCACVDSTNTPILQDTWTNSFSLASGTVHALGNNVTVTGNNVVLTDAAIAIAPNISITVANGASLTLDHCHLYACDTMWQGIVVEPGGVLNITGNSLIEDAITAVDIQNHTSTSPVLDVNGATFNRNYIAVGIQNYQQQTANYPFEIRDAVFTSRDIPFTPTTWATAPALKTLANAGTLGEHYTVGNYIPQTLKAPYTVTSAVAGIYMVNVGTLNSGTYYGVTIDGDNGNNTLNLFDHLLFGIYGENTNYTARNNAFQYITENQQLGIGGRGIYARNNNIGSLQYSVTVIDSNAFYDVEKSVYVRGYNQIDITATNIRSTQMPDTIIPAEGEMGIFVETPYLDAMDITDNIITNVRNGIVFLADVDGNAPPDEGQQIGPVNITENIIQATLAGNSGTPTGEYVLNGIIADNTLYAGLIDYQYNPIVIADNKLYQVHNGIHVQGWYYLLFTPYMGFQNQAHTVNNYISLRKVLYPNSSNQPQYGIYHLYNYSGIIENNMIKGFDNSYEQWYGICALDIINPNSFRPSVKCNTTDSTGTGVYFNIPTNRVTFRNNTMDNNQRGYVLDGADIDEQGDSASACGNRWINFTGGNFKTFTAFGSDPNSNVLWIDTGDSGQYPMGAFNENDAFNPTLTYSIGNGLSAVSNNGNSVTCSPPQGLVAPGGGGSHNSRSSDVNEENNLEKAVELAEKLVTDSSASCYSAEQAIIAKYRAYGILQLQQSSASQSAELQNFTIAADAGNIGKLYRTEQALANGSYSDAAINLNNVTPENTVETNYKAFYTAYLHMKQEAFSSADSTEINRLVHGCAKRDGIAVYQARVLHRVLYKEFTTYWDNCSCANEPVKQEKLLNKEDKKFRLYPNPNNGIMTFEYLLNKNETGQLLISDITGKKVADYVLSNTNTEILIDEKRLDNGVYLAILVINENSVETKRIVIVK